MSIDDATEREWNEAARLAQGRINDIQELAEMISKYPELNPNELAVELYSSGVRYLPEMMREQGE